MLIANRYEATGAMSWGGISEVHRFDDKHLGRSVMLKRVMAASNIGRLLDEQKALLALRSRHVVELLDIVKYDYNGVEETGLILEHIAGSDLQEGSMVASLEYVKTLWQIAAGLTDIHAAGVIHRDIKPANLRMDGNGVLKIIDFGLSRQVGIDDQTKSIVGSFGYIAPELTGAGVITFTSAVDVFAFGATAVSLVQPVLRQSGPMCAALVNSVLGQLPPDILTLIASCVAIDPAARPKMVEVRDKLASHILHGQHRAWLNQGGSVKEINSSSPTAKLTTTIGTLEVTYNGTSFVVSAVSGDVSLNNIALAVGRKLSSSGVIIFGGINSPSRAFITFDVSNPEVSA